MVRNRFLAILGFMMGLSTVTEAQILDDSTKTVYGPTTTRWITVKSLKHNDTLFQTMDSTLSHVESFQVKKKQATYHYDLGNNGTAMTPIYYQLPTGIGRWTGFTAYDPFVKTANDFRYYDTKSPYIRLDAVFGATGRNVANVEFSRNISPEWNFGFDISRVASQKQLGSASFREKQVLSTVADFYTYYHTKNRKYHVMFHALRFDHEANETGGIVASTEERDFFQYLDAEINLSTAFTADHRTRLYMYQQYSVKPFFEAYTVLEHNKTRNEFNDFRSPGQNSYYQQTLIRTDTTSEAAVFDDYSATIGIKGRVANRIFYSGYIKRRQLDYDYRYETILRREAENYLGGDIKIWVTKTNQLGGRAEIMDDGRYLIEGTFNNGFLTAGYTSMSYMPSLLSERYFGNHYDWQNSFKPTYANSIKGSVFYQFSFLRLEPHVELTTVDNFVYYGTDKLPAQTSNPVLINKYGVKSDFTLGDFHLDNHLIFNNVAGQNAEAMPIPDLNWFGRWYYANILFKNDLELQLGFDLRWQSAFYGRAYDPITQQFHIQNDLKMDAYFASDLFLVMKSNDLTLFFKINYLNQKREDGYFETAFYPGMRRVFDMGVRWMFFD